MEKIRGNFGSFFEEIRLYSLGSVATNKNGKHWSTQKQHGWIWGKLPVVFNDDYQCVNYGNKTHIDDSDAAQAITIWHEAQPLRPGSPKEKNVTNWYFLFPDLKIKVDGKWKTGVAIPLQHGTVISWDANAYRHCTAPPAIEKSKDGIYKTIACGTFFVIAKEVANYCKMEKEKITKHKSITKRVRWCMNRRITF